MRRCLYRNRAAKRDIGNVVSARYLRVLVQRCIRGTGIRGVNLSGALIISVSVGVVRMWSVCISWRGVGGRGIGRVV